ncbi:hypothetical protein FFLO_05325 [Filobasidium floriforme]|uniref:Uncharacterized protein n=1 Tax=Filobasidium floriforme TaxID=5210 RepID=A0A8K0JIR4_9TREE|nr:hypothetical protein FFLO_05325 [Filobasidium floriforme]
MTTSRKKNVALVGLSAKGSWASQAHLPYFKKSSLFKIHALQNSSKSSATSAAEAYSLDGVVPYGDPSETASDPEIDIVAVSVKVPMHKSLLLPAIDAGKDVFCEWPLARNLQEAREIVQLAKSKGVKNAIGLQARQDPAILKAKEIVRSGQIGEVMGTNMFGHGGIFTPSIKEDVAYLSDIDNGANLLTIPFGHAIVDDDGKPIRISHKTAHDYITVNARLIDSGGVADITYAPGNSLTGKGFYWEITGTEGSLVLEGPMGHVQIAPPTLKMATTAEPELRLVPLPRASDATYTIGKAWDAFVGVGLDEGHTVTTFEDALRRHEMIDAIYRSAESGRRENYV